MPLAINRPLFFYPLLVVCIWIDFFCMCWLGTPFIYSLLALSAVALSHKISNMRLVGIFTALALESFLLYGQWGVQLIYLIPIAFISRSIWDIFTRPTAHAIIILTECLIAQTLIIDSLVGISVLSMFTLIKISINILLTISISLTYI